MVIEYSQERAKTRELYPVAALAVLASIVAFIVYYARGEILLYGDAVAHINIARRVIDSRDPGLAQLGTVWLPFPHIAQLPFIVNDWMWRTGVGPSIPSMIAYVLGVIGIFRLIRARATYWAAAFGAAIYGLNPSLLYMQSTAMTESIFLTTMIWAAVYVDEYIRALFPPHYGYGMRARLTAMQAVWRCALVLAASILSRYDGWIYAFIVGLVILWAAAKWHREQHPPQQQRRQVIVAIAGFMLICALAPTLWLIHNYRVTKNPFDWFNGPYSAKAIEKRTTRPGDSPYPGKNDMRFAGHIFLKDARMVMSEGRTEKIVLAVALLGTIVAASHVGHYGAFLLLWIPLPFYAYSIAYGSVPIFMPVWWPCSYYNTRYGMELLPMFAVMIALGAWALGGILVKRLGPVASYAVILLVALAYASSWVGNSSTDWGVKSPKRGPICYREGVVNSIDRRKIEAVLVEFLRKVDERSTILMPTSQYVGALQQAGIPLKRVISEATYKVWDEALADPSKFANYAISINDDAVAKAIGANPGNLSLWYEEKVGTTRVAIYAHVVRMGPGLRAPNTNGIR